jgi:plasmid stabilization system protein ParE
MKVRFTATALAENNEIRGHITKESPIAAKAVILRIEQVVARIAEFPYIARRIDPSVLRVYFP